MRKEQTEMRNIGAGIIAMLCLIAIAGCTTNKSIANITTSQGKLELAVGTINDSAGTLGLGSPTLNVVTSFRNNLGNSAYQQPGFFSLTGPSGTIIASDSTNTCDELFGYGQNPVPQPPLFPVCESDSLGDILAGVPPTYSPADTNGIGYSLGFIQTGVAPVAGNYNVSTTVTVNGANVNFSANATLNSTATLPNATGVTSFVSDGAGGGTFTIGNPLRTRSKVHHHGTVLTPTEYLIVVSNSVISSVPIIVATVETTNTSATIVGSGNCLSGNGFPIPCGGNTAYVIDADYPLVEAGPPTSHSQTPTLVGPSGSADISVSPTTAINE
ncbi:MAG TPA: hypothetical protein VEV38_10110 [Candidatus Eremiobacteraceae bacterium]|nr:hypothetical protein [Candidatus Eremiobacteraceae bacterium]